MELTDGGHQSIESHHLALDPATNVLERVHQHLAKLLQLVHQAVMGVTRDQLDIVLCALVRILVVFEEVGEVLVVTQLLLFGRD